MKKAAIIVFVIAALHASALGFRLISTFGAELALLIATSAIIFSAARDYQSKQARVLFALGAACLGFGLGWVGAVLAVVGRPFDDIEGTLVWAISFGGPELGLGSALLLLADWLERREV